MRWLLILVLILTPWLASAKVGEDRESIRNFSPSQYKRPSGKGKTFNETPYYMSVSYAPHFMVVRSEDQDSIAEVASQLSHRVHVGFGLLVDDYSQIQLGLRYNNWQLEESRDVARLLNTSLDAFEVNLSYLTEWTDWSLNSSVLWTQKPYLIRQASNRFRMESGDHLQVQLNPQYAFWYSENFESRLGVQVGYFSKDLNLEAELPSGWNYELQLQHSLKSEKYFYSRLRYSLQAYMNIENSRSSQFEREFKEFGIRLKLDYRLWL